MASSEPSQPFFIYTVSILSAIGGFLFGYDTGIVSGAMVLIKKQLHLNDVWQELIVSVTIGMAWAFSSIAGIFTDRFGRRPVILVASAVFTAGSVVMAFAMEKWTLLIGRAIVGMGIGLASMVVPMYIAEVAPDETRGVLVGLNNCFITGGQFIASVVAGFLSYFDHDLAWRLMLGIAGVPAFLQFVGFFFMPESPRWLIKKGKDERAIQVLTRIRGSEQKALAEFQMIRDNCVAEAEKSILENSSTNVLAKVFASQPLRRALFVGCALQAVAQASGINTVMYYSATIIQMSGVYEETLAIWLAAAVASVNFLCTFIGFYFVERTGRRYLTLGSLGGTILALLVLAAGFQLNEAESPSIQVDESFNISSSRFTTLDICSVQTSCRGCIERTECGFCFNDSPPWENGSCLLTATSTEPESIWDTSRSATGMCSNGTIVPDKLVWAYDWCPTQYAWVTIMGLCLYLFFFAPGMGPMPWTINAEIYPFWARGVCYSISTSVNWAFNLGISLTFLSLTKAITKHGAFYLYCSFACIGWIYFVFELPETRGTTLENVEELFRRPKVKKDDLGKQPVTSASVTTINSKTPIVKAQMN